jgi:homogentisate 1,2-dioxygenase
MAELRYQSGFLNEFATEAEPGALLRLGADSDQNEAVLSSSRYAFVGELLYSPLP